MIKKTNMITVATESFKKGWVTQNSAIGKVVVGTCCMYVGVMVEKGVRKIRRNHLEITR